MSLPKYQSFKVVEASRITEIEPGEEPGQGALLTLEDGVITVEEAWMLKHNPQVGGWFVRYADGYESFSPDAAFKGGYHRIQP